MIDPKSARLNVELEGTQKVHTFLKPDRNSLTQKIINLINLHGQQQPCNREFIFHITCKFLNKVRKRNRVGKKGDKNKFGNGEGREGRERKGL